MKKPRTKPKSDTPNDREALVKKIGVTISTLCVGFTPHEFLTGVALATAAIIHARYQPHEHKRVINAITKNTTTFLRNFKS